MNEPYTGVNLNLDFLKDVVDVYEAELIELGVSISEGDKNDPVIFIAKYNEFKMRRITPAKRQVHISSYIKSSKAISEFSSELVHLKDLCLIGGDLLPYQSKSTAAFEYREGLLFDWGIQHLHLGSLITGQQHATRTKSLLFAMFTPADAYFICIMAHGNWAEIDILNIIDSDWPDLLERFVMRGVVGLATVVDAQETIELRRAGVTIMQQLSSGKCIVPPGGGITTAKTSTSAMFEAQQLVRHLNEFQYAIQEGEQEFRDLLEVESHEKIILSEISFNQSFFVIVNTRNGKAVKVPFFIK